jgi:8-oxo-dGTP diphosphatase
MIDVAAGLLKQNGKILLCKRPTHKSRGGKWEFPGGKLESGETAAEAIYRELQEELNILVSVSGVAGDVMWIYPDVSIHLTLLHCTITGGSLTLREHEALAWVAKEEALSLDLAEADRKLVETISF